LPVMFFDKNSRGSLAYLNLAAEVIRQSKKKKAKGKVA